MVIKYKVSDIAKDFGKNNKDIINILSEYCEGPAKKANTVLEENELNILFDKLTEDNSVESLNDYFNSAKKAEKKKPAEKKNAASKEKKDDKEENKKHKNQAAILQMAEQAAKRAEEKAKKKASQVPQARTKGETRHVDTRVNNVDLEKYKSLIISQSSTERKSHRVCVLNQRKKQKHSALPVLQSRERNSKLKLLFLKKLQ